MSSEALYEQYKDALKRGHVASLRGQIDEAVLAYAEAARIAPERSTPHSSSGIALMRRGRPADALRHFEVALAMAPGDESALLGRAQALAALGRHGEGADAFDALAEVQAGSGRLAEAVDTARRGLELAEGRDRRRTLERLITRLRASEPDEPGRLALERALQVLDGLAVPRPKAAPADRVAGPISAPESAPVRKSRRAPAAASPTAERKPEGAAGAADDVEEAGPGAAASAAVPERATAQPTPAPVPAALAAREISAGATAAELATRAEAAADAGVPQPAVDALLDAAALHARDGHVDAALDACYIALSFDPDSVALHLAMAELYIGRGWDALAAEKLGLLERLARLDGDEAALAAVARLSAIRA